MLRDAAGDCDAIVTSGGVSMGDYDVVKAVLGRIAEMTGCRSRSSRPSRSPSALLGPTAAVPVFGLPGNPVSSLVSFELFARPALRRMMGHAGDRRDRSMVGVADADLRRRPDGKVHYRAGRRRRSATTAATTSARSAPRAATSWRPPPLADALAVLPDGDGVAGAAPTWSPLILPLATRAA